MTLQEQIITIIIITLGTMTTRFLTFMIFPPTRKTPIIIDFLSKLLPTAVVAMIVVYAYKEILTFTAPPQTIFPTVIATIATIIIHLWKRQLLLSISVGTLLYMFLYQIA